MLYSMNPWFSWNYSVVLLYFMIFLFLIIRMLIIKLHLTRKEFLCCSICFLLCFFVDIMKINNVNQILYAPLFIIRHFILICLVISLKPSEKILLVNIFTSIFSFILFIGLIFYAIYNLGINLPHTIISYENNSGYPNFNNYLFLLIIDGVVEFDRFQSIFLEPGHVGMISALLLYVNGYNLHLKSTWIMLISILFSLSLAAYILLVIGVIMYYIFNTFSVKKILVITSVLLGIILLSVIYYNNNPDSIYSKLIVSRLEYDSSKGIKGNNRTDESFNYYYNETFYRDIYSILFGISGEEYHDKFEWGNSSYRTFIVNYGLVGLLFLLLLYVTIVYINPSSRYVGLLLLYIASFLQRPYALWEVELFLFISAGILFKEELNYLSLRDK